jgi:Mg/Co/Ni transporter MgtE
MQKVWQKATKTGVILGIVLFFIGFAILAKVLSRNKKNPDRPSWKWFMGWSDE